MSTTPPVHDDYPVGHDIEVVAITKQATDLRQMTAECAVDSPQQVEWASALLGEIATLQKSAEARRVWFVDPLNQHVKSINALFKSIVAPLVEADRTLRHKVLTYRDTERRRAIAEQERIRAALAEAERVLQQQAAKLAAAAAQLTDDDLPEETGPVRAAVPVTNAETIAPAPPAPTVRTALGTTTARRITDFEVVDIGLVPKQFLLVDESAIRIAIWAGLREMPGLRIFQREILAVRTGA